MLKRCMRLCVQPRNLKLSASMPIRMFSTPPPVLNEDVVVKANRTVVPPKVVVLTEEEKPKKSNLQKMKFLWKRYGLVAVGTYLSIYGLTLTSVFVSLETGLFSSATFGIDPVEAIGKACDVIQYTTGAEGMKEYFRENPTWGTLALAWIMTKFTEPPRLALTVAVTPKVSKVLGQRQRDIREAAKEAQHDDITPAQASTSDNTPNSEEQNKNNNS